MKTPSITPKHVGVAEPDDQGGVVVHIADAKGAQLMINLSAELRSTLGAHLLSGRLADQGTRSNALYLGPTNTRAYLRQDGDLALELQIGHGRAVHILLPGLHAHALVQQIQEVLQPLGPVQ